MDRKALKLPFTLLRTPDWVCPTCRKGMLRVRKDSFSKEERKSSRNHSHDAWEPEWIEFVYSCLLDCNNDQCKDVVGSTGIGGVDVNEYEDQNGEWVQDYDDYFRAQYFTPHLILLDIPSKCPDAVSMPLQESFRLFFASPGAASNHVRIAIEELLTELKVKRFNVSGGKRRFISLHQRIQLLPAKYATLKDMIVAIKWLGNAGSHSDSDGKGSVSMDDVMDSYELTEHILHEIYASKTKKLTALAKKVNQKKGPAK